ncbi:MAG: peptidoglycan-associated lipoprotein Pal [Fibrobacter sp.]|nr:peptidoglycan-associated lipoprotein Pal [Fibrobacter sp.]
MSINKKWVSLILAIAFAWVSCSKPPPPVVEPEPEPEPEPVIEEVYEEPEEEDNSEAEELARLEAERQRLEVLLNSIMSNEVYFAFDRANLTSEANDILVEVGDILKNEPRISITIEGHTDERGTEAYNMTLGEKRANSVLRYLSNYGVEDSRLNSVSYGEERPKVHGSDEEAWAQNRRAAFRAVID